MKHLIKLNNCAINLLQMPHYLHNTTLMTLLLLETIIF